VKTVRRDLSTARLNPATGNFNLTTDKGIQFQARLPSTANHAKYANGKITFAWFVYFAVKLQLVSSRGWPVVSRHKSHFIITRRNTSCISFRCRKDMDHCARFWAEPSKVAVPVRR